MFAPHDREYAQFGLGGEAAQTFLRVGEFIRCQVVLGNQFRGDGWFGHLKNLGK
jgi:hypothetical protein